MRNEHEHLHLLTQWRTLPDVAAQGAAALQLLHHGGLDFAISLLEEGLPGNNAGKPVSDGGELDNATVRHLLAKAIEIVLLEEPSLAFEVLSPFLQANRRTDWFGAKRAELTMQLLLAQLQGGTSSWLSIAERKLFLDGKVPDTRWLASFQGLREHENESSMLLHDAVQIEAELKRPEAERESIRTMIRRRYRYG